MTPEEFKKICEEYDNSPADTAWEGDHPIFQLATHNDKLNERLRDGLSYLMSVDQDEITVGDCLKAFGFSRDDLLTPPTEGAAE